MKYIKTFEDKYTSDKVRRNDFCIAYKNKYLFLAKVESIYTNNSNKIGCSLKVFDYISDIEDSEFSRYKDEDNNKIFKYNIELSADHILYFSSSYFKTKDKFETESVDTWTQMISMEKYNL